MQLHQLKILLICAVDEMWSFVRGKNYNAGLWYAWEPTLKRIIAHAFGDRSTNTLNILLKRMENFNVSLWCYGQF